MKYRRKLVVVDAVRFKDYPGIDYLRDHRILGSALCLLETCQRAMDEHGKYNGQIVCPNDWIVIEEDGSIGIWQPGEFADTFEVNP